MCGITGIAPREPASPVDVALLQKMTDCLRHRGPDAEGMFSGPGIGLGSRRLSIIDLQTGDQPIANEDGSVVVVCNGEIYNYIELRSELLARGHTFRTQSDTEVIVHLYEESGTDCVKSLRGMFAIALWDSGRRRLFLARDRFGIKPLYYAETAQGLYFASEQKAILESDDVPREVSARGLNDLLTLGFIVAPATLLQSIRQLMPGTSLVYEAGVASTLRYWDASFPRRGEPVPHRREEEWAEELREKLDDVVRLHLRSDVEIGAWLSGGLDSSAIVSLALRHLGRPIHAASLSFQEEGLDEIRAQKTLLDFPQYKLISRVHTCSARDFARLPEALWFAEDPSTSCAEILRLLTGEMSREDVKVVLTGEGADEVFLGYSWFWFDKIFRPIAHLPHPIKRAMLLGPLLPARHPRASGMILAPPAMNIDRYRITVGRARQAMVRGMLAPGTLAQVDCREKTWWELELPSGFEHWESLSQLQYYELNVRLPSFINHILDRGSMAFSVEARVPFLDHELAEFAAQIPLSLKMKGLREKHILRRAVADVLPREVVERKKRGLRAPVTAWLRKPLPEFAAALLSESSLRRKGYFVPAKVRALLAEHQAGQGDWAYELLCALNLQLWDEIFLQGHRP
jgi:asparagine synthase (glutamine-hydrolysing)